MPNSSHEALPRPWVSDAAAMAGAKAIAEAGVDPRAIGLLVDTSVCRERLEPSASVDVHRQLGLSSACVNFDLSNACLVFSEFTSQHVRRKKESNANKY